ncbi:MAG: 50S ribosomal protein L11 methyltransferase [Chloroherpetonaceae bacterium]|nr:50S ribosomal protein L11 methyltransferase [Chthonomonadaceae bacterium]MDW8206246.1 50S ribosomal protein L11 methyltransferase [Chloroherpetonaceae bacterium]
MMAQTAWIEALWARLSAQVALVTRPVVVADRVWQVTCVEDQDALLDAAVSMEHFPYGYLLWEASVGLARYLATCPEYVRGREVLELGCGVGLSGIIARSLGAQVWQTDHLPGALQLAEINALQNGVFGIERFPGDWRQWAHDRRYDVLIGADVFYDRAMHFYLEAVFARNLKEDGVLIIADPVRPQALEFAAHLEKSGWHFQIETLEVCWQGTHGKSVEVVIWVARRGTGG